MVLSCDDLTDDELVAKLRSCFSYVPTMNAAREELRNMRQLEHESISVYTYRWGRALYRSSGICPENKRHPHVIKDFISSLKKTVRTKIANKWAEMTQPPSTVQKAFKLANDMEKIYRWLIASNWRWSNNNNHNQKHSNFSNGHNFSNRP